MDKNRYPRIWGIIIFAMVFCIISLPAYAKYSGGSGTAEDPYQIATAEDLIALGEETDDYDKHFILIADIDLDPNLPGRRVFNKAVIAWDMNDLEDGFQGTPFTGAFEGNGYTISNLTIEGGSRLGLFGQTVFGATISNLGLEAVDVNGTVRVGGLVGYNDDVSITNCYSTGSVSGERSDGGLVGVNGGTIAMSYSTGYVSGNDDVGGLVGYNYGFIDMSYSTGVVNGEHLVGGLVGDNTDGWINLCYSTGSVSGNNEVGGLVGENEAGAINLSYSTGAVNGEHWIGGLLGGMVEPGWIWSCYSTGSVSGNDSVGGLVGYNPWDDSVMSSFWDIETSGQVASSGGIGLTNAEMQMQSTFTDAGWDFIGETTNGIEDIWWIDEGLDYPKFVWQISPVKFVQANIINVPGDYPTIQQAIDAAVDADTVLVAPGEYVITEPISFQGKGITVRSEGGPEQTMIRMSEDQTGWYGYYAVVLFVNGEGAESLLEGLTLTGSLGSGVSCVDSSPSLDNCVMTANYERGVQCLYSSPTITNCIISGSVGDSGVNCRERSSPIIINCAIRGNSAIGSGGGGVYCNDSSPTIINCIISGNDATRGSGGGGVQCIGNSSPILTNCTVAGNSAGNGGGVYCDEGSSPNLINCTITENSAEEGGGVSCEGSSPVLTNCIVWGNVSGSIDLSGFSNPQISFSCIEVGFPDEGNIDTDPLFAALGYWHDNNTPDTEDDYWVDGDYHLKSQAGRFDPSTQVWVEDDVTSPCIDAGDPLSPVMYEPYPRGCIINMGAYGGTEEASKSPFGCSYEADG